MQLLKLPKLPPEFAVTITEEAIAKREELLALAIKIQVVTTPDENAACADVGSALRGLVKEADASVDEVGLPFYHAHKKVHGKGNEFKETVLAELDRLGRLAAVYRVEQERKAEDERRKRAEEIARLQEQERKAAEDARLAAEKGDLVGGLMADIKATALAAATDAAVAAPPPEATKTAGQSFKARELGWECTDPIALWNARPDLCNGPTPKASAIKATCAPERPVPGLKLWWEVKVNFKSR